jgi:hypothetical protein
MDKVQKRSFRVLCTAVSTSTVYRNKTVNHEILKCFQNTEMMDFMKEANILYCS